MSASSTAGSPASKRRSPISRMRSPTTITTSTTASARELIDLRELREVRLFRRQYDAVVGALSALSERRLVHETIRRMINFIVGRPDPHHAGAPGRRPGRGSIDDVRAHPSRSRAQRRPRREEHLELKKFLRERVYRHYKVLRMTSKARRVLTALFEAFFKDVSLMPPEHRDAALQRRDRARRRRPRPGGGGLHRRHDGSLCDFRASAAV